MTVRSDNNLRIAITGTLVVHALLFVLLAWLFAGDAARKLWLEAHKPPKVEEKEVTMVFPDQIMEMVKPPPPPVPKREVYIRTSQNQESATAPKQPAFIADRNTNAATVLAPSPDATEDMPTLEGVKIPMQELANRDFHDGDLKDDARPKTPPKELVNEASPPPAPAMPLVPPQMRPPAPAPQPEVKPQAVAKAVTEATTLTQMMEESAKMDSDRLSLEVKKAERPEVMETPAKTTDMPPKTETLPAMDSKVTEAMPQESQPQKAIPKALPVMDDEEEPVTRTTANQDPNSFTPHTRTSQTKGRIDTRGNEAAVDAEATPKGRYIRQVLGQVEKKWHLYCKLRRDGVTYGHLQITFYVNKKGKVEGLRIMDDKESNPILTELTVSAIRDADIPPMPAEVVPSLPMNDQGRLKIEYKALIY